MPENNNIGPGNAFLAKNQAILTGFKFLERWLINDARSILAFSRTCKIAWNMSSDVRKKQAIEILLTATVCGDENLARKIVISRPELLQDSSAIVIDLSGKVIKELTPPQAAICAGDADMVQMIKEVLQQKLKDGKTLIFDPELEIRRQLTTIYPNGVDSVVAAQEVRAQEFEASNLRVIFDAINAAISEKVKFELDTPGKTLNGPNNELNKSLRKFRREFAARSNLEQIFNPFYLLKACEFYNDNFYNFDNFDVWDRRDLFLRQVIGYIQCNFPACFRQATAQGMYYRVIENETLRRDFKFRHDKGFDMRSSPGDLKNLGFEYAGPVRSDGSGPVARGMRGPPGLGRTVPTFKKYCEQINEVWNTYLRAEPLNTESQGRPLGLPDEPMRNRGRFSNCNIC